MVTNLHEELIYGSGWCRVMANDINLLTSICEKFTAMLRQSDKHSKIFSIDDFRKELVIMDNNRINILKMQLANITNLSVLLQSAFKNITHEITGNSIFLQRRTHIMFNIPGNIHTATMHHMDAMSGISPHSFILWAPLHDIDNNSGVYMIDQHRSMALMNKEQKSGLVMSNQTLDLKITPLKLKFGEGVVFNPFVIHGSIAHTNELARIGITNRFQSRSKPLYLRNSEFFYPCQI